MSAAGGRELFQGVKRSVRGAAVLLFFDGAFTASFLWSWIVCPIWFLVSLVKNAIQRPGWGLALLRIGIPALTLALVLANNAVQNRIAEANARRVIAACEAYHAAHGAFPQGSSGTCAAISGFRSRCEVLPGAAEGLLLFRRAAHAFLAGYPAAPPEILQL